MMTPKGSLALAAALLPSLAHAQVRVLFQNDLSPDSKASSALLVYPSSPSTKDPSGTCGEYNEQLVSASEASDPSSGIQDQINYLVFRGDLNKDDLVFVAPSSGAGGKQRRTLRWERQNGNGNGNSSSAATCSAWNVGTGKVEDVDCSKYLPALCTNSAPPYTTSNASPASGSDVTTSSGSYSVTGYRDARSLRFLGLPFAEAPVKELRFQAAQPLKNANKIYNGLSAKSFGKPCIQYQSPFGIADSNATSEDCLTLNVFTPAIPGKDNKNKQRALPVAFWIYGGAFEEGAGSLPDYDGGNMASRGDVVVVTINYRLGALGNMASDSLAGSQGITDQIQALKWVKEYIHYFGGDPDKVTIFGQSAGGQSVVSLLSSSKAKGLFSGAISQSAPWNPFPNKKVFTDGIYPALLNSTNCTSGGLQCLQSLDASTFISDPVTSAITAAAAPAFDAYAQVKPLTSAVEPLLPVVGTGVVDGLFVDLVRNGKLPNANINLMIGNVRDEGPLFVDSVITMPVAANNLTLQGLIKEALDASTIQAVNDHPDLFNFNQSNPDALRTLAGEIQTLDTWQCPLQQVLTEAYNKKTFKSLYSYRMDKGIPQNDALPPACTNQAPSGVQAICHSEDISEVFGTSNVRGIAYDGSYNNLEYNQYVIDTWTAFIRTGDPQPNAAYHKARGQAYASSLKLAGQTPWNAFTPSGKDAIQLLNLPPSSSGLLYPDQCKALAGGGFAYDNVPASVKSLP